MNFDNALNHVRNLIATVVALAIPCECCGEPLPLDEALSTHTIESVKEDLFDGHLVRPFCGACAAAEAASEFGHVEWGTAPRLYDN